MPSTAKRVNLTLDREMLDALDAYKVSHHCNYRAQAVYHILWEKLIEPRARLIEGGE